MLLVDRRQSIFPLIVVIFNLFTNIHSAPLNDLSTAQPKDSVYNQLIKVFMRKGESFLVELDITMK